MADEKNEDPFHASSEAPSNQSAGTPSEEREKRWQELKKRLREIEELKRQLNIQPLPLNSNSTPTVDPASIPPEKENTLQSSISDVREAIEEIQVPPLEMLDDLPLTLKKKKTEGPV